MMLTGGRLAPILAELDLPPPTTIVEMKGGSAASYRLDLPDRSAVVLKTYRDEQLKSAAREAWAAGLLDGMDIPATRYLLSDESRTRLPFAFAITTYLPGVTAASLEAHPDMAAVHQQMGALLGRLHAVRLPGYGNFGADGLVDPVGSNVAFVRRLAAHAFERFRHYGADPALAERLEQLVAARLEAIAGQSPGAVFAHADLHPGNILVTEHGGRLRLSGLIDFGNAHAADPVFDLAKCLLINQHDAPGSGPAPTAPTTSWARSA
jgi:aminoglycoside phosphotransferase (APT) family kinase protein